MNELKFNVSESKLSESCIENLSKLPVKECLAKLKDCIGVTSPDFQKSSWGTYTQPKQPRLSFEFFKALKNDSVRLEIRQRRGYKCFAFVF